MPTTTGYITQEKYILGRTLTEIEHILGFHSGRLSQGALVLALEEAPQPWQFEFAGYSQVAGQHFEGQYGKVEFDRDKMKAYVAAHIFKTIGPDRLVKVIANQRHNPRMADNDQYPPGAGAPQWKLTSPLRARTVAELQSQKECYMPNS